MIRNTLIGLMIMIATNSATANDDSTTLKDIQFDYEVRSNKTKSEESYFGSADSILDNPALASGLNSGTDAINRSIDGLIESMFYNLLDNERVFDITDHVNFSLGLERRVLGSVIGKNVVIDKFSAGPNYSKEFYRIHNIPISLTGSLKANMYDIYLRSNPMRVSESVELPFARWALNNWLGTLPLLSYILPPSFNPNEMYDPINQFTVPFSFPSDYESFNNMSIGNIKSYAINGGISVPIDLVEILGTERLEEFSTVEGFELTTPFAVFVSGSYRINVLKRTKDIAWVGLSKRNSIGQSIHSKIGNEILLLTKTLGPWPGLPASIYPLDVSLYDSYEENDDLVFAYDLSNRKSRKAYEEAIRGNFIPSFKKSKTRNNGIRYHFTRKTKGDAITWIRNRRLFVEQKSVKSYANSSLVEVNSPKSHFYIYETKKDFSKENANILTGSEKVNFYLAAKIPVTKTKSDKFKFKNRQNPFWFDAIIESTDSYIDTRQYATLINFLSKTTMLSLKQVPTLPLYNKKLYKSITAEHPLMDPENYIRKQRPVPMLLGKLNTHTKIRLHYNDFKEIFSLTDNDLWRILAITFGKDPAKWSHGPTRESFMVQANWLTSFITLPLRLINIDLEEYESLQQAYFIIKSIRTLQSAKGPEEVRLAFSGLFSTEHPEQLLRALVIATKKTSRRRVSFHSRSHGQGATKSARRKFNDLNDLVVRSVGKTIPDSADDIINRMLTQFSPNSVSRRNSPLSIERIQLANINPVIKGKALRDKNLYLRVSVDDKTKSQFTRLYIRFEHASKLQLGNFVLSEYVTTKKKTKSGQFNIFLTGPLSKINNLFSEQAVGLGGEFKLTVAASTEEGVFTSEKSIFFRYEDGKLLPPLD